MTTGLRVVHNIETAHRLTLLPGRCEAIHGHSMLVTLTLYGPVNVRTGSLQIWTLAWLRRPSAVTSMLGTTIACFSSSGTRSSGRVQRRKSPPPASVHVPETQRRRTLPDGSACGHRVSGRVLPSKSSTLRLRRHA